MGKRGLNIVVVGNATLDAYVQGEVTVSKKSVSISSGDTVEKFFVEDPPIRAGHKHRVNQNIEQKIRPLLHYYRPGGGGYNSVTAISNLPNIKKELELFYMDVSNVDQLIANGLKQHNINSHFFFQRDIPVNAIIGYRKDKIILKGPQLGRVEPDEDDIKVIYSAISKSDALLINSIKDTKYLEQYLKISKAHNIIPYLVITTSLEWKFAYDKIMPHVKGILNYDELPGLLECNDLTDEQTKMEIALETLRKIRKDGKNKDKPLYVTLGRNGAYCAKKNSIIHVKLNPDYTNKVSKAISKHRGNTTGAGDVFAGAITAYDATSKQNMPLHKLVIKASEAAIRHIGYKGKLPRNAFLIEKYPIS